MLRLKAHVTEDKDLLKDFDVVPRIFKVGIGVMPELKEFNANLVENQQDNYQQHNNF